MPEFKEIEVAESPYLYVERTCSMAGDDIAEAMGSAFSEVWAFMEKHGVAPTGGALSVYYDYGPDKMTFRTGFTVAREDMAAAQDPVKADVTPAGRVMHFTHVGPYATLREDYGALMAHMKARGLDFAAPTWEVYMNGPDTVPEEKLITECYQALAT